MDTIRQRDVLKTVLIQVLSEHPNGLVPSEVYDTIVEQYSFPEAWYRELPTSQGYEQLKSRDLGDWRSIPQMKLVELVKTEPQWQNELRWSRNWLRNNDFLDTTIRGIWKLTDQGMKAATNASLTKLQPAEQKIVASRKKTPRSNESQPKEKGNVRENLLAKLSTLTHSMPTADLELLVDIARAVRSRNLGIQKQDTEHRLLVDIARAVRSRSISPE